jgi:tRNA pseudouridine55 synthase
LRVGPYDVAHAHSLDEIERAANDGPEAADELLLPMDSALASLPQVALTDDAAFYVGRGQAVFVPHAPTSGLLRLYDGRRRFMGVGEVQADGRVKPRRLMRVSG